MARFLLLVALSSSLAGCGPPPARRLVERGGETMGSTWSVKLVDVAAHLTGEDIDEIHQAARDLLQRIDTLMSTWDPGSELSRFNASRSTAPFSVAPETADVFRHALSLSADTGGAFDVTVAPIVEAWGFGAAAARPPPPPDAARLAALLERTGMKYLRLDRDGRSVQKLRPDVACDFSALAPGYAADRVAALLDARGVGDFLVDVGGEMVARGRNASGRPWQVAIERPDSDGAALSRVVPLTDAAMATSGDYRNYREIDGRRVAHIVDPRSGQPVRHRLASATVVDREAVRADALATALMVLGPEEGMALAERLGVAALLLVRRDDGTFEERRSARMNVVLGGR